jgi:hypothetical protein
MYFEIFLFALETLLQQGACAVKSFQTLQPSFGLRMMLCHYERTFKYYCAASAAELQLLLLLLAATTSTHTHVSVL